MNTITAFVRDWLLPPKILTLLLRHRRQVYWSGDYPDWETAAGRTQGYSDPNILQKVLSSTLQVKAGEAVFERDSVAFAEPDYSWEVAAALLYCAAKQDGRLYVLDFGGALGSLYYQYRIFFQHLKKVHWHVVEQKHFVKAGKKFVSDASLSFYETVEQSQKKNAAQLLILSGVLPYLKNPHEQCSSFLPEQFEYILLARTPFTDKDTGRDRLTIQTVKEPIYNAQYPSWFFSKSKLLSNFKDNYEILFEATEDSPTLEGCSYQTILLKRHN